MYYYTKSPVFTAFKNNFNATARTIIRSINKKAYINGEWVSAISNQTFEVKNPANSTTIGTVPDMNADDASKAIQAASDAFQTWQHTTAKERSHFLRNWYNIMASNKEAIARIMTAEAGKPLTEALGEVAYGNSFIEWYSEEARRIRGETVPSPATNRRIIIEKQPIGVVGLITPWNFPHAMITRKAGAALAAGCTCVIKPAEDTPFTALALMEYAEEAGIPKGVLNVVTSDRPNAHDIGNLLCDSPLVAGISFTGSTQVGKHLYRQCSGSVKRLGLELGGNAPFIVYESADLNHAVAGALAAKFRNCGQTCVSANRFLIQDKIYDAFVDKLLGEMKHLKLGDGSNCNVNIGPLINQAQLTKVSDMVDDAVAKGGRVLCGGKQAKDIGELFYEPTILVDLNKSMAIYNDEVFGPIISIIPFGTEEESLKIANSTNRGLAGYFYSEDLSQILRVSKALEVGMCGINEGLISTAEAPFGGIKESGLGREGSHHGIEDYVYYKYLCVGNLRSN